MGDQGGTPTKSLYNFGAVWHTQTSFLKLPWGQKQKKKTTFKLYDLEFVGLLGTKMENEVICFAVFLPV